MLEEEIGPLSALDKQFCAVISLTGLGRFTGTYAWCGNGAPPRSRVWLAHAFIAKSVYQFPTTAGLLDALRSRPTLRRLCGWARCRANRLSVVRLPLLLQTACRSKSTST